MSAPAQIIPFRQVPSGAVPDLDALEWASWHGAQTCSVLLKGADVRALVAELRHARALARAVQGGTEREIAEALDAYGRHAWANALQIAADTQATGPTPVVTR